MGVVYTRFHKPRFVNQAGPIELTRFEKTVNGWGFARGRSPLHVQNIITRRQRNAIVAVPVRNALWTNPSETNDDVHIDADGLIGHNREWSGCRTDMLGHTILNI